MKPKSQTVAAEIPTSSMADIAFLLIIFFMLTLTFASPHGLDFRLPEDGPAPAVTFEAAILVEVLADRSLRVDGHASDPQALLAYLGTKLRENPLKPVILHTAPTAPYSAMVETFDILHGAQARLNLPNAVQVALPTQREVELFW